MSAREVIRATNKAVAHRRWRGVLAHEPPESTGKPRQRRCVGYSLWYNARDLMHKVPLYDQPRHTLPLLCQH
jgi:hypothetical protein